MSEVKLALDIGTSKLAAVAVEAESERNLAVVSVPNDSTVPGLAPGRHEQDPRRIRELAWTLLAELCGQIDPAAVTGIAFSGQMHGVVLTDGDGESRSNFITWCDQRAAELCSGLERERWPEARTGCLLHPGYGGATLALLRPERGLRALSIADYLAAELCGVAASEPSCAASWGIFDVRCNRWDEELVAQLGLERSVLPEIRPSAGVLGRLRPEYAARFGLSRSVAVHSPVGDNQAGYLGVCGRSGDSVLLNLGTGGQISLPVREFRLHPGLETRPLPDGTFLLVGASLCGGRAYAILKDFFAETLQAFTGTRPADGELYAVMDRLATAAEQPLTVDTRFAGSRLQPELRGAVTGIGVENFTPGNLARGVAEGMVEELAAMLPPELGAGLARVCAGGNAVRKSPLLTAFVERRFGLPCVVAGRREEAAAGAALAALWYGGRA